MLRFISRFLFSVCAFGSVAAAQEIETAPSLCPQTAVLAGQGQFSKPTGPWVADYILVDKGRKLAHLMAGGKIFRSYHIALGLQPVGKKHQEGDNKTPEGLYSIGYKNSASDYHLSLNISYPNQDDINYARQLGVDAGGDIMLHGLPNVWWKRDFIRQPEQNWTHGCVAFTDEEIEEVYSYVQAGTAIELCP